MLPALRAAGIAVALSVSLVACASDDEEEEYVEARVEPLYDAAVDFLLEGDYIYSASAFNEVERQHPYSQWATRAQLMSAYSFYQYNEYDNAILASRRFLALHPGHRDAPYAYYLIGLSFYEQISDVLRDQEITEQALGAFNELVRRYPDSDYARDARLKIDLARDHLAGKEMAIARYYLGQRQYVAAISRFRQVIEKYETTTHVPEALHRLTESYTALGLRDEARAHAAILGHNYPGSRWYRDTYRLVTERRGVKAANLEASGDGAVIPPEETGEEDGKSFLSRAWNAIF